MEKQDVDRKSVGKIILIVTTAKQNVEILFVLLRLFPYSFLFLLKSVDIYLQSTAKANDTLLTTLFVEKKSRNLLKVRVYFFFVGRFFSRL